MELEFTCLYLDTGRDKIRPFVSFDRMFLLGVVTIGSCSHGMSHHINVSGIVMGPSE